MTGNAYRLGQLFAAADAVHAGYCADIRDGALPPALLGNEILGVALRGPIQGLDLLAPRLRPSHAWARQLARPPKADPDGELSARDRRLRDAYWALRDLARLSRAIDRERLGEAPNDLARAEMILGYLAGSYEPESRKASQGETTHEA